MGVGEAEEVIGDRRRVNVGRRDRGGEWGPERQRKRMGAGGTEEMNGGRRGRGGCMWTEEAEEEVNGDRRDRGGEWGQERQRPVHVDRRGRGGEWRYRVQEDEDWR